MLLRVALWGPLLIAALLAGAYVYIHDPFARDGTELLQVPLSEEDSTLDRVGDLKYLGGLDIPRMGQNVGGLSGLRWDTDSGRLLAITDDARWVWLTLIEENDALTGIEGIKVGDLLGPDGEPLTGKERGDSESLMREGQGHWVVGFERDHRILAYDEGLSEPPVKLPVDPVKMLGQLADNGGLEAMAVGAENQLICAERLAQPNLANCALYSEDDDNFTEFPVSPTQAIVDRGGVPTDADTLSDGTFVILFRAWSSSDSNRAAIVTYAPDGERTEIATIESPLTADNFEGLAVREEGEGADKRTFLYIVSDDNFSASQRTLLMKFEIVAKRPAAGL